jgi:hypothetical protein
MIFGAKERAITCEMVIAATCVAVAPNTLFPPEETASAHLAAIA